MAPVEWTFASRLAYWATLRGDDPALIWVPVTGDQRYVTFSQLNHRSTRVAGALAARGVRAGDTVVVGLPNAPEHVVTTLAAWRLGAGVLPLPPNLPARERQRMLELARPRLAVASWPSPECPTLAPLELDPSNDSSAPDLADASPPPFPLIIGTGGSTGRPKLVRLPIPGRMAPNQGFGVLGQALGISRPLVHLICGPLYHGNPFAMTQVGLFEGQTVVLLERFSPAGALAAISEHRVQFATLVPTMMKRIAELPDFADADLDSLQAILHTAAPCPPAVKRVWIDVLGPKRLWEAFGSSESVGYIVIRGDDWLAHPGSIGRPLQTDVRILDATGREVPPGMVGEIYLRLHGSNGPAYEYVGHSPATQTADGYVSVGDLGWVDTDGWYYSADRSQDLIISGGANIVPAEVEAALLEHPAVADAAAIGLPDPDWGRRVHALVVPRDSSRAPSTGELDRHCRQALAAYKVPKGYEIVDVLPRTPMGKLNRSELVQARAIRTPAGATG